VAGGSAYPRILDFAAFAEIAREVEATFLVDMAHFAGLVAGRVYPSPISHADIVTSTTHKTLRGPRGGFILCRAARARAVDKQIFPGTQGGPLEHVIAAKAVGFGEALKPAFREYAAQIVKNAVALGEGLMERGYRLVSGGTDTHLLLVDLRGLDVTGKEAEEHLGHAGIHVNKNTVPGEQRSPFITSGIRLGTAALTTRGMTEDDMRRIAGFIDTALKSSDDATLEGVGRQVRDLTAAHPFYLDPTPAPA
jgi:glycine hydroxymethyltransferase